MLTEQTWHKWRCCPHQSQLADTFNNYPACLVYSTGEYTSKQQLIFYQSRIRTIKMLLISLCAFLIGWLPTHLTHLIDFYILPLLPKECNSSFWYNIFYWISISSCCYNPFIYCWFDKKIRSTARRFFCCCFPSSRKLQTPGDSHRHVYSIQTPRNSQLASNVHTETWSE